MKNHILIAGIATLMLASCAQKSQTELTLSGLNPTKFQTVVNDAQTGLYTLKNKAGMEVCITNFGGRIVSIMVPDKNGEMKDVVVSVNHITDDGAIGRIDKENLEFGYRTSVYRKNNCIITGITLKLKSDNPDDIRHRMDDFMSRRIDKQPLEFPSAGSVFKRPEGNYAGALIEQCGFKGKGVGGAEVSEKHAGFIINKSNATAKDVKELISQIQTTVKKETGYDLECELIML